MERESGSSYRVHNDTPRAQKNASDLASGSPRSTGPRLVCRITRCCYTSEIPARAIGLNLPHWRTMASAPSIAQRFIDRDSAKLGNLQRMARRRGSSARAADAVVAQEDQAHIGVISVKVDRAGPTVGFAVGGHVLDEIKSQH